jgi:hypothetical protein
MKTTSLLLILALPSIGCIALAAQPPQSPSYGGTRGAEAAQPVAAKALRTLGGLVNRENAQALGFDTPDQAKSAALGTPLEQFLIGLNDLKKFEPGSDPNSLLAPSGVLTYPVLVGGSTRSSVTVSRSGGTWRATAFGSPSYVRALTEVRDRQQAAAGGSGVELFEVQVRSLNLSFVGRRDASQVTLIPIIDDARFGFKRGEAVSLADAVAKILPAARHHNGLPT